MKPARVGHRRSRARLLQLVLVPLLIALLGTGAVAAVAWRWYVEERDRGLDEQTVRVDRITRTLERRLGGLADLTRAAASRWSPGAQEAGTTEQWETDVAAGRSAEPSLFALLYLESVGPGQGAAVEERFLAETGRRLELDPSVEHLVLTRGSPATVLGLDLAADPAVPPVLARAATDLTVAAIDPSVFGIAAPGALAPVAVLVQPDLGPDGSPRGYGVAAFAGGALTRDLQGAARAADGIDVVAALDPPVVLGTVAAVGGPVGERVSRPVSALEPGVPVTAAVTPLTEAGPGRGPLALLAAGSLLSVLLGALLFAVSRSRDRAEAAVVRATEELVGSEQRLQALVRHAADLIAVVDADGRFTFLSPSVEELSGYPADHLLGRHVFDLSIDDDTRAALTAMRRTPPGRADSREVVLHRADGSAVHVRVTITNLLHEPAVGGYVANIHDISDHKAYEALLSRQAREDPLTGLPNRARLEEVLESARDAESEFAVLFVDLDGFKSVNDELGHEMGDEVLRQLAARLQSAMRPADTLLRLGGDEFVVVAPGSGAAGAGEIARRIERLLQEPFSADGRAVTVGASIGVAVAGPRTEDLAAVVRRADAEMYRSKLASRSG
jgi:diguanylate cyclase (GGDEF)-like protein/PAS domain S-box-containing protein